MKPIPVETGLDRVMRAGQDSTMFFLKAAGVIVALVLVGSLLCVVAPSPEPSSAPPGPAAAQRRAAYEEHVKKLRQEASERPTR